jgi:hypothetical protein
MKSRKFLTGILSVVFALMFNTTMGAIGATLVGCSPMSGAITLNAIAASPQVCKWVVAYYGFEFNAPRFNSYAYVGLAKEIWIDSVMDGFYPNDSFLSRSVDMSVYVDNDKINLAEAGVDPTVLINNTSYPVAVAEQADTPISLVLDTYDTENTVVRNAEQVELVYDKLKLVTGKHQKALRSKFGQKAVHSWCPASDATFTPVFGATGGDNGNTLKRMTLKDFFTMAGKFNNLDLPIEGRVCVLSPLHLTDLALEDKDLFKVFMNLTEGQITRLFGFDVYVNSKTANFNKTTGVKTAFGAAAAPATDTHSSLFYVETEVMRADGTTDMFFQLKSPTERGDIIGFQKRALALPIRSKAIGAIFSPLFS